jgi:hypothetical protein
VPYIDIGNYKIERQEKLKENKIINLIEKKQWQKEQFLGSILYKLYPSIYIKRHDRKKLNGLELDYYIPELQIAFEYDGEQHFDKNLCENIFQSNFEELQKRDRKKNIKCRDLGIKLIRIKYDEPLTLRHIKKKLKESP